MAQIFVSHSSKDLELRELVAKAFASTKVKGVFEEFEAILQGPANAQRVLQHISQSNAVFMLLGRNVQDLPHTRDWVAFEGGAAAASSTMQPVKDIWVIESIDDMNTLSFVVPRLQHYISLDPKNDGWQGYLTQIISSYDDSHVLPGMAAGGLVGAAARNAQGALVGVGVGLLLAIVKSQARPVGVPIHCPQCASVYNVHLSAIRMRCPVCNLRLIVPRLRSPSLQGQED